MKSFLKQINESFQTLDEKDWDGDGEQESPKDEYMGVKDKAIKRAMKKEAAKPDFLDLDNDGDTEEDMKDAANEDEIEEASTSAGAGSYMTPKAFGKADDDTVEALGYKRVQEVMDRKYEQLIEGYRDFALSDAKMSPAKKVNASIREVAKKLKEIEETIKHTGRLKTESGIAHSGFSSGTHNALRKISERLIKISERVRSLGE
tara:strand:+ start:82 stop:693 length:612 start_codon:yes stop_codon:yes gene_type:complete